MIIIAISSPSPLYLSHEYIRDSSTPRCGRSEYRPDAALACTTTCHVYLLTSRYQGTIIHVPGPIALPAGAMYALSPQNSEPNRRHCSHHVQPRRLTARRWPAPSPSAACEQISVACAGLSTQPLQRILPSIAPSLASITSLSLFAAHHRSRSAVPRLDNCSNHFAHSPASAPRPRRISASPLWWLPPRCYVLADGWVVLCVPGLGDQHGCAKHRSSFNTVDGAQKKSK